jgi:hypothetical protein
MERQSRCDASCWQIPPVSFRPGGRRDRFDTQNSILLFIQFLVNGFGSCSCRGCGLFATSKHHGVPVRPPHVEF